MSPLICDVMFNPYGISYSVNISKRGIISSYRLDLARLFILELPMAYFSETTYILSRIDQELKYLHCTNQIQRIMCTYNCSILFS